MGLRISARACRRRLGLGWLAVLVSIGTIIAPAFGQAPDDFDRKTFKVPQGARLAANTYDKLYVAAGDGQLYQLDTADPAAAPKPIGGLSSPVVDLQTGEQFLAVLLATGELRIFDPDQPPRTVPTQVVDPVRVFVRPQAGRAVVLGKGGAIKAFDLQTAAPAFEAKLTDLSGPATISDDLKFAAYVSGEEVRVVELRTGKQIAKRSSFDLASLLLFPEQRLLVTADQFAVERWDFLQEKTERIGRGSTAPIWRCDAVGDGVLVLHEDGLGIVYSLEDGTTSTMVKIAPRSETASLFVASSGSLCAVLKDGTVVVTEISFSPSGAPGQPEAFTKETVWYATNRSLVDAAPPFSTRLMMTLSRLDYLGMLLAGMLLVIVAPWFLGKRRWAHWLGIVLIVVPVALAANSSRQVSAESTTDKPGARFGNNVDAKVRWGRCLVSVPSNRAVGDVPVPAEFLIEWGEDPEVHFILEAETSLEFSECAAEIRREAKAEEPNEILLFVHGYNVPFEAVAKRTAQLKVDLEIDGPAFFFSWPSYGREVLYSWDETNAEVSHPGFTEMLTSLTTAFPHSKLHLIAHSMGNRVVMNSLCRIRSRPEDKFPGTLTTLILAAPDIDRTKFKVDMQHAVELWDLPLTLYVSNRDRALGLSSLSHSRERLGSSLPDVMLAKGMQSVDASRIETDFLGHGYFANSSTLLADITQIIKERRFAESRPGLREMKLDQGRYWEIQP